MFGCPPLTFFLFFLLFRGKEEKKVVLWESVWFYGLIRKSIIKERSEGDGGDERETLKGLECFVPARPGPPTHLIMRQVIKHTGTSNFGLPHSLFLPHTRRKPRSKMARSYLRSRPDVKTDCQCHVPNHNKQKPLTALFKVGVRQGAISTSSKRINLAQSKAPPLE